MTQTPLLDAIHCCTEQALASGALSPLHTQQAQLQEAGLGFSVRWVDSLAAKAITSSLPGGPRDPNFNPFLPPDPALTVGPIGTEHTMVLNKFPVCLHHLVLARREFAEQRSALTLSDFLALTTLLCAHGGLGFYNGGPLAGASQRHKHVQWLPDAPDNATLGHFLPALTGEAADTPEGQPRQHPALPFAHAFFSIPLTPSGGDPQASAESLLRAYQQGCALLQLQPDADGLLPPYNLLTGQGWLLMVPRSQEHFEGVSINALSYGGTLYVREPAQLERIRQTGALHALAQVGHPR